MSDDERDPSDLHDFGIFYPRGHLVVAFQTDSDAQRVRQDLITGGYDPDDCLLNESEDVERDARQNLAENTGWLARLGRSDEAVRKHLEAAKQGRTFLLIYAPGDLDSGRAMNVVRRVPFAFAHRYHRFAIEEMK